MRRVNTTLKMSTSPHFRTRENVSMIMWHVNIALIPALIASLIFFGQRALFLTIVSVLAAIISEILMQKLFQKPISIKDGSAVLTGLLLAFNVSPAVPWWIVALGSGFAIVVAKQLFGGLGQNIFNPALIGRAFLLAAYPSIMTAQWISTRFSETWCTVSTVTGATPLNILGSTYKLAASDPEGSRQMIEQLGSSSSLMNLFLGNCGGCIGETSALALLLGGLYLLWKKIISWHIPVAYIGTMFLLALCTEFFSPFHNYVQIPLYHVLSGGLLLGALFMATDMVTSPISSKGKLIFGIGCGVIAFAIRKGGGYPEGVSYSILIMNAFVPIIDRYCLPRIFGKKSRS